MIVIYLADDFEHNSVIMGRQCYQNIGRGGLANLLAKQLARMAVNIVNFIFINNFRALILAPMTFLPLTLCWKMNSCITCEFGASTIRWAKAQRQPALN